MSHIGQSLKYIIDLVIQKDSLAIVAAVLWVRSKLNLVELYLNVDVEQISLRFVLP